MLYYELLKAREGSLVDDIPVVKTKSEWRKEKETIQFHYPSKKQTRKFNEQKARESRAKIAYQFYTKMIRRLDRLTEPERQALKLKIRALRPSMKALKDFYRAKGESEEFINKIVTPENYPTLPNVWISKRQERALLDIVDGKAHKHKEYITKEFY